MNQPSLALCNPEPGDIPLAHVPEAQAALHVLVVDDSATNCLVLGAYLEKLGYRVTTVCDGDGALDAFLAGSPDLVLLNVMMPGTDSHDVTRRIKALAGSRFTPVIFLTTKSDEDSFAAYAENGADDFLVKPFNVASLGPKIEALMRTRDLYGMVESQRQALDRYRAQRKAEVQVVDRLFSTIVQPGCLDGPNFRYFHTDVSAFNGGILLAAGTPAGGVRVLVGAFTGQGWEAAVGALPISDIFYGMTKKGFALGEVVRESNDKLRRVLPVGRFLAAALLELDATHERLSVWSGGLSEILVLDGRTSTIRLRHCAQHLPLGAVSSDQLGFSVAQYEMRWGDRIYACSDGVMVTENAEQAWSGAGCLEKCATQVAGIDEVFDRIVEARGSFSEHRSQGDAATLIEIHCDPTLCNDLDMSRGSLPSVTPARA